jgi:hypothetical protein
VGIENNVKVVVSEGGECFVCNEPIEDGNKVISVSFAVPALITTVTVHRQMHLMCAEKLGKLLEKRLKEARTR